MHVDFVHIPTYINYIIEVAYNNKNKGIQSRVQAKTGKLVLLRLIAVSYVVAAILHVTWLQFATGKNLYVNAVDCRCYCRFHRIIRCDTSGTVCALFYSKSKVYWTSTKCPHLIESSLKTFASLNVKILKQNIYVSEIWVGCNKWQMHNCSSPHSNNDLTIFRG